MNHRQKKRIKNTALMVKNVDSMAKNMESINQNYATELQDFINAVLESVVPKKENGARDIKNPGASETSLTIVPNQSIDDLEGNNSSSETKENPHNARRPQKQKKPPKPWAKDLYRKIMLVCHPDRNHKADNIDPETMIARTSALEIASSAYKENRHDELVYAGAIVDVFSSRLPVQKQIEILNKSYGEKSRIIEEIQGSISWHWGVNWDSTESRVNLVYRICASKGINLPSKQFVIDLLENFETK